MILAEDFDRHDMKPETIIQLKTLFDALDRPKFLGSVPKVSKTSSFNRILTFGSLCVCFSFLTNKRRFQMWKH